MLTRPACFEDFIAARDIELIDVERLARGRGRVVVSRDGHILTVSFNARRPTRFVMRKLAHALKELAS